MPRAIIAIRNYPVALLLAALLFAASLILAAGSLGYIGGDDEGSGLGGTGKNGDFGGSGLGGTGAPSPFFGASEENSHPDDSQPPEDPGAPAINDPEALDRAMRRIDQAEPQMLRIREPVQTADLMDGDQTLEALRRTREALRQNALQRSDLALQNRSEVIRIDIEVNDPVDSDTLHENIEPYTLPPSAPESDGMEVASGSDDVSDSAGEEETADQQRVSPERIQRPELPPFQRIRPVQRASIAAPRPRPMRI